MDSPSRPTRSVLRRPNGRPQACEPCRKRKIACDHSHPVCRRCQKANRTTHCQYIIDPHMTIITPPRTAAVTASPVLPVSGGAAPEPARRRSRESHATPSDAAMSSNTPELPDDRNGDSDGPTSAAPNCDHNDAAGVSCAPGYLGFTSHSYIYEEMENRFCLLHQSSGELRLRQVQQVHSSAATTDRARREPISLSSATLSGLPELSPKTLQSCLSVLRNMPPRAEAEKLFNNAFPAYSPHDFWSRFAATRVFESIYDTFGRYIGRGAEADDRDEAERPEGHLEEVALARILCCNTAHPLSDDESDPDRWVAQFTGRNLRWEPIGVMFAHWAMESNHAQRLRTDPAYHRKLRAMAPAFRESMSLCVDLSRMYGDGNILLLYVLYKRSIIQSMVSGDASPMVWRFHSEAVSLLTALGLHDPRTGAHMQPYEPTLTSELKRRLCAYVFNSDKGIAAFTGRPPMLSRRYTLTPLPLDISEKTLLSGREEIAKEVAQLDDKGWRCDGRLSSLSIIRARVTISHVKDELFEIALGNGKETSVSDLLEIERREYQMVADLPAELHYNAGDTHEPDTDHDFLYSRMLIRLEHLQNVFFIHRLLIQGGHRSQADLIWISFEMVSLTLLFWTHLDRVPRIWTDFEWLVMAYAAPGGGILCQELLQPSVTADPHATTTSTNTGTGAITGTGKGPLKLPSRFAIIEKLFLLVGYLDWVSPDAPNGDMCGDCKKVIRHVLERTIGTDGRQPVVGQGATAMVTAGGGDADAPAAPNTMEPWNWDLELGGTYIDYGFELLDTFDWLRPEFGMSQGSSN